MCKTTGINGGAASVTGADNCAANGSDNFALEVGQYVAVQHCRECGAAGGPASRPYPLVRAPALAPSYPPMRRSTGLTPTLPKRQRVAARHAAGGYACETR